MFEDPRKQVDLAVYYAEGDWYWWCPQCDQIGGKTEDPDRLEPEIRCYRCHTRYNAVLDYPMKEGYVRYTYLYEYLPPLIFEEDE